MAMKGLVDNRPVLIGLGMGMGAAASLNLIGAQSYLLAETKPIYLMVVLAFSNIIFALFLRLFSVERIKFSYFCILFFLSLIMVLSVLTLPLWGEVTKALLWFGIAYFMKVVFIWMLYELASRYLNPAVVQAIFPYLGMATEVGTVIVVLGLLFLFGPLSPNFTIFATMGILSLVMMVTFISFYVLPNPVLMKPQKQQEKEKEENQTEYRHMFQFFLVTMFLLGLGDFFIEYLGNTVWQHHLVSYERINRLVTFITLVSSGGLLALDPIIARNVRECRPSPIFLYAIYSFAILAAVCFCYYRQDLGSFVLLYTVFVIANKGVASLAKEILLSAFNQAERTSLQSYSIFAYFVIPNIIVVVMFGINWGMDFDKQVWLLLGEIVACMVLLFGVLYFFYKAIVDLLSKNINSKDREKSVLAAHLLSYLNPIDFVPKMNEVLNHRPKHLLRKIIILGLGYKGGENGVKRVLKEFKTKREEIQLAALDSLQHAKSFTAIEFIIDLLTGAGKFSSIKVRFNAARILAAIYGKNAIPILLSGLKDEDPRIQANAIEVLGTFKDSVILTRVLPFIYSTTPRVKANALVAIAGYRKYHEVYRQEMINMLQSRNANMAASALYAIGKTKDKYFAPFIHNICNSKRIKDPMIRRCVEWALAQLKDLDGYRLYEESFASPYKKDRFADHLHFFSQLDKVVRFTILEYMFSQKGYKKSLLTNTLKHLRYSKFDFQSEIDFVEEITGAS